jgi:hypothetical protein
MEGERILKELLKKKLDGLYDDTKVIVKEISQEKFRPSFFCKQIFMLKALIRFKTQT